MFAIFTNIKIQVYATQKTEPQTTKEWLQKQNRTLYIYLFSYKKEPKTMLYLELNYNKYNY